MNKGVVNMCICTNHRVLRTSSPFDAGTINFMLYSFTKYFLSTYYVQGVLLGSGYSSEENPNVSLCGAHLPVGKQLERGVCVCVCVCVRVCE